MLDIILGLDRGCLHRRRDTRLDNPRLEERPAAAPQSAVEPVNATDVAADAGVPSAIGTSSIPTAPADGDRPMPCQEFSTRGASRGAAARSSARSARACGANLAPGTPLRKCSLSRCPSRRSATMHSSTLAWDTLDSSPQFRQTGCRGVCVTAILHEDLQRSASGSGVAGPKSRSRLVASQTGDLYRLEHCGISSLRVVHRRCCEPGR